MSEEYVDGGNIDTSMMPDGDVEGGFIPTALHLEPWEYDDLRAEDRRYYVEDMENGGWRLSKTALARAAAGKFSGALGDVASQTIQGVTGTVGQTLGDVAGRYTTRGLAHTGLLEKGMTAEEKEMKRQSSLIDSAKEKYHLGMKLNSNEISALVGHVDRTGTSKQKKQLRDYLEKSSNYVPMAEAAAGGGCGCGLTYSGAAEIYADRLGLPMNGVQGGGDETSANGGCCGFIQGGALDIAVMRDYDRTINSVTKDQIVDDIVAALGALGLKASGTDRSAKVNSILAIIPNQKKNGKSFKADAEKQAGVCKSIAKVINDRYGRQIVDPDGDAANVCQAVSEIAHSLRDDMHMEFLVVNDEVKRVIKNLLLLKTSLEQMYQQISNKVANSKDPQLQAKAAVQLNLHKLVLDEITRQLVMLQNLVDVTLTPADVDIAKLLSDHDEDVPAIIQQIERGPRLGTTQFGDVISKVLIDLGVTAGYAAIVEKALKTVGVTVDEYAKSTNLRHVMEKINKRLLDGDLKDKDLHEYLKSAELLYRNFYRAKDIASVINRSKSGGDDISEDMSGGYTASYGGSGSFSGGSFTSGGDGDSLPMKEWKTGLDSRVKDKRAEKQIIFRAFNRQINEQFDVIVKSLNVLAGKIGSEIPITDQLDGFRDAVVKLKPLLNSKNAFISLIGYYNDALSRERRETFIAQLRMINTFVEALMEMGVYSSSSSYFRDIHSKVSELMKTIDQYSDRIATKYGSSDVRAAPVEGGGEGCQWLDDSSSAKEGGDDGEGGDEVSGGYGGVKYKGIPDDVVSKTTALTIRDAITKFDYYYRTAQVKNNFAHSAKELEHYAENYVETRGNAIAKKIDYARKMRDGMIKDLEDDKSSPWFTSNKSEKKYIKKFLEKQTLGLVNFWRTVEAIDEYMRVYTDGIAKHPEEVKDIKDMLDETEVIYDAYDDDTGNELVRVFELFPNCVSGYGAGSAGEVVKSDGKSARAPSGEHTYYSPDSFRDELRAVNGSHYYDKVAAAGSKGRSFDDIQTLLPGNPYLVVQLRGGSDVGANVDNSGNFEGFRHIRAMMGRFMILKNLMNVFIHIGSKFGGKEIYRDNFMKPIVIYRNLLEYLEISAFGMGLSAGATTSVKSGGSSANGGDDLVEGGAASVELTYSKNNGSWSIVEQQEGFAFGPSAVPVSFAPQQKGFFEKVGEWFSGDDKEKKEKANVPKGKMPTWKKAAIGAGLAAAGVAAVAVGLAALGKKSSEYKEYVEEHGRPPKTPRNAAGLTAAGAHMVGKKVASLFSKKQKSTPEFVTAEMFESEETLGGGDSGSDALAQARIELLTATKENIRSKMQSIVRLIKQAKADGVDDETISAVMEADPDDLEVPAAQEMGLEVEGVEPAMSGGFQQMMSSYVGGNSSNMDDAVSGGSFSPAFKGTKGLTYEKSGNTYLVHLGVAAREVTDFTSSSISRSVKERLSAMQKFGVYMRSVMPAFAGCECFQEADQFFVRIIKCLCAKVLTTVGMYDVLQRPYEPVNFSPVRMILGAGRETPQIVDGAVELYFRLPLLAEFYRDLFTFNAGDDSRNGFIDYAGNADSDMAKITMIPEMEGMFSGIIKLVFKRGRSNKIGEFTDEELKDLITEVNKIYSIMHSRHGDKTTLETIYDFVKEMNMRYGIIKKKDRDLYEEAFGDHYDYGDYQLGDQRPINMAILPGEEDMDYERGGVNPSLKYEQSSASELKRRTSPFAIKYDAYKLFTQFRCMIDNYFMKVPRSAISGLPLSPESPVLNPDVELDGKLLETGSLTESFRPMIQSTKMQVKMTQSADEKFELVAKMLRGSMSFESAESSKYLMFHETVVTGLNTLSAVHTILRKFQKKVLALDYDGLMKLPDSGKWTTAQMAAQEISKYYYSQPSYVYDAETSIVDADDLGAYYGFGRGGATVKDAQKMFTDFVETVFAVSRDLGGMVDMKIVGSGVGMNFSNLIETIEKLFESVKYFLDLLRPYIKEETDKTKRGLMEKFVDKLVPGSYYWLQEQLIEKLVKGRDRAVSGSRPHEYVGLTQMQRKINSTFKVLLLSGGLGPALARIAWWHDGADASPGAPVAHDMSLPISKLFMRSTGAAYEVVHNHSARYSGLYAMDDNKFNNVGSVVLDFNDLLAKYLYQFYDGSSEKIYKQAVEGFVNTFNQEIMNPSTGMNTLLDMSVVSGGWTWGGAGGAAGASTAGTVKGIKTSDFPPVAAVSAGAIAFQQGSEGPKANQVLLESLAVMLRNIVSSRSVSNQSAIYMLDNIAEVSIFMKDRYRSNMPLFKNLFSELLRKAEFLKELLEKHELPVEGVRGETGAPITDPKEARSYVSKVLASVVRGCMSMISCIEAVMREVADDPKYLETRAGSMVEYKNIYGKDPLAPISILTLLLKNFNNGNAADTYSMLPFDGQGSSQSKFRYGTRGILARIGTKVGLAQMPGFKKIVDTFNMTVNSKFATDTGKVDSYVENLVKLLRYVNEYKFQKGVLAYKQSPMSTLFEVPLAMGNRGDASMYAGGPIGDNVTFSIKNGFDQSITLVESSDQSGQIADVCIHLIGRSSPVTNITIRNIIDLNIVPINVNALMRDIPLVNMYNYEWTFNRMVIDLIFSLQDPTMASKLIQSLCAPSDAGDPAGVKAKYPIDSLTKPQQMSLRSGNWSRPSAPPSYLIKDEKALFASLLINPYRKLWDGSSASPATQHHQLLHNMMSGRSLTGLSRPKFLSDQLYNKALLRQVYSSSGNTYPGTEASDKVGREFVYPGFSGRGGVSVGDKLKSDDLRVLYDINSQLRLDTVLCRDLMFITDSYRILRLKLRRDLMYSKDLIVRSHALTREDVTEFDLDRNKIY